MSKQPKAGDKVSWSSHGGTAHGKVVKKVTEPTTIKSHKVAASKDNPEFIVETDEGKRAAHKPGALKKADPMPDATFKPTMRMASAARRGLRLREKFGRGGTDVGVRRAQQLADRSALDAADVRSMHSYFARHAVDKDTKTHQWDSNSDPSAGFIAWLLWGGDAGKKWADGKAKSLDG